MNPRPWWIGRIEELWKRRSIIWLTGVRRSGKTLLCRSLSGARYLDCELPSVRRELADPESFLRGMGPEPLVLDEIHRLQDPAQFLKIAADYFPRKKIIATGSSTLGASAKFSDTLAGRKAELWLTPLCEADEAFPGIRDRAKRFLNGGLPGFFLAERREESEYSEWFEAYWARDILELFRLERRSPFMKFAELLLAQSGGRFEAASFAALCGVSRTTIQNYLAVLEATRVVHVIRPYSGRAASEIVSTPLVYGFDTGFVAWAQALHEIPPKEKGFFWEHLVLNEIFARSQSPGILTWRDKQKREVDFVWAPRGRAPRGRAPTAIEAKWRAESFEPRGMVAFRALHPDGRNFVIASDVTEAYTRRVAGLEVTFCPLDRIGDWLEA
jgi:predicted AAA+ superfamily ATPase